MLTLGSVGAAQFSADRLSGDVGGKKIDHHGAGAVDCGERRSFAAEKGELLSEFDCDGLCIG